MSDERHVTTMHCYVDNLGPRLQSPPNYLSLPTDSEEPSVSDFRHSGVKCELKSVQQYRILLHPIAGPDCSTLVGTICMYAYTRQAKVPLATLMHFTIPPIAVINAL